MNKQLLPRIMAENGLTIDKEKTALILIDLQKGIVGRGTKPYDTSTVVSNAVKLVSKFRENNMPIFFVHVNFSSGLPVKVKTDSSLPRGEIPADWSEFIPEIGVTERDHIITKHQWGAFYGTELEQQLRRMGIDTIVLGGIATTYGVESTARFAYEYGFNQVFPEDAMGDFSEESHKVAVEYVLKRMGLVRSTEEVLTAL